MRDLQPNSNPVRKQASPHPTILPFSAPLQRLPAPPAVSSEASRAGGLVHDARNLLAAIGIFCDLLATPGVLAPQFRHYAHDLRRVGETGARLLESLTGAETVPQAPPQPRIPGCPFPAIEDLGSEVRDMEGLLRLLAGPQVLLEVAALPCEGVLGLNSEDLLRILFNLAANAVEAMRAKTGARPLPGRRNVLRITVQPGRGGGFLQRSNTSGRVETLILSVRDNGPGIDAAALPLIFDQGFSTATGRGRGMGLAIVRQLTEAAGGTVRAVSAPGVGTRFDLELPILSAPPPPGGARGSRSRPMPLLGTTPQPPEERRSKEINAKKQKIAGIRQERRVEC